MKHLIHQFAAYDLWANTRVVERLQREPEATLDRHVKSSFPSLRKSLLHIRDSGNVWYSRIFELAPMVLEPRIGSLMHLSAALRDKVLLLDEGRLQEAVAYTDMKGRPFTQPRWQLLLHCYNHASYHRGQVITMMHQLDLGEVPNTDLVAYQRMLLAAM
ncbi:MAG: hypothetical protein IT230_03590 [Flavobacteriales bacterium]|nr:hypothetical protein [Flavobacteriales bacterium]